MVKDVRGFVGGGIKGVLRGLEGLCCVMTTVT